MMRNDDLTIYARSKNWDLFSPDWGYLLEFPALELRSLCALSVGLRPQLADAGWVFAVALPHFDASDRDECFDSGLDDAHIDTFRVAPLREFLRRLHIAAGNLAPAGSLPILEETPKGEMTMVKVAEFVAWAKGKGWAIPPEFATTSTAITAQPAEQAKCQAKEESAGTDRAALMERRRKLAGKKAITKTLAIEFQISESMVRRIVREEAEKPASGIGATARQITSSKVHRIL